MVYLKHNTGTFWRCHKSAKKTATISFGKCGYPGRTIRKHNFKNGAEVMAFIRKRQKEKMRIGYVRAKDPTTTKKKVNQLGSKRRRTSAQNKTKKASTKTTSTKTKTIKKRKNPTTKRQAPMKPPSPKIFDNELEVDAVALARVNPGLSSKIRVHDGLHAELAQVGPINKVENFYIIQVLVKEENEKKVTKKQQTKKENSKHSFFVFSRFGRTGTQGFSLLEEKDDDEEGAKKRFCNIFKFQTGVEWSSNSICEAAEPQKGKFQFLNTRKVPSGGFWQGGWMEKI